MASSLTPKQLQVLALVDHYHDATGEAAPASYIARKLAISKQRVQEYFRGLSDLGWLRSAGSPAIPTRPLPGHDAPLTIQQLPTDRQACDVSSVKPTRPAPAGTIEMLPLSIRADIAPKSVNDEARTVDLIWTTGAPVERMDWWTGKRYIETLSLDPAHVRIDRLNQGGPVLDGHSGYSVGDVLGVVVPGSVVLVKKQGRATVRFSKRDDVEPKWQDVKDGIVRSVSVGYRVYKFEETVSGKENAIPIRLATDWEPFEISMVPIPADAGASVRGERPKVEPNRCEVVMRNEETRMDPEETRSETIAEVDLLAPPVRRTAPPAEPNERDEGAAAENERVEGIRLACLAGRMTRSFEDRLIKDRLMSLSKAQGLVFEELRKRGRDDEGPARGQDGNGTGCGDGRDIEVGSDPLIHVRAGIEGAILNRISPDRFQLDEKSKPYRGMSMLDVGRAFLHARGIRTTNLDRSRLVDTLLTRAGLHTTTDFPGLFEDAANKTLRAAYEAAPQTWLPISKLVSLSDFKPSRQLQVGDAPALLEILEHGEYTFGTIGEAKETIQLKTYGRMFGITRQALINDDLNAFGEVPAAFGRKARDIESDLAWAQITANGLMGDGVALFAAAAWPTGHANLTTGPGTVLSIASLGVGRAALRAQKGIDNATILNLSAKYLIVPAALETLADQFLTQIAPALAGSVNPFSAGGRTPLAAIVEPRLDVNSALSWYMATDSVPVLYHGILDGQTGPLVTQQEGFDVDGMKFRCRIDVAFKAADPRAIYKNVGA